MAWAIFCWPWLYSELFTLEVDSHIVRKPFELSDLRRDHWFPYEGFRQCHVNEVAVNPALLYPALALVAFVGWKAAWAIGRRMPARKAEQV